MRKIIAIISVFSLFFSMTGHQLAFLLQLQHLKLEMRRNIRMLRNSKDIVEFAFDEPSFARLDWEEENEFRFNGEMYDVIEKRVVHGKILVLCIPDRKETQLLVEYQKQTQQNQSPGKQSLLKWVSNYLQPVSYDIIIPVHSTGLTQFPEYMAPLFFRSISVITPPPDHC